MLRQLYSILLRLHPRGFRERFSGEMFSIFEESPDKVALLVDACVSVLRQQVLRPGDSEAPPAAPVPDGVPMFHMVDDSLPRKSVLLQGALLSLGAFAGVVFAVSHGGSGWELLIGTHQPIWRPLAVNRDSIVPGAPTTTVKVPEKPVDWWLMSAEGYFKNSPVLRTLDSNHDFFLTAKELDRAPAVLLSLDLDHDGKLSLEECLLPKRPLPEVFHHKFAAAGMMRGRPELGALDADHDGEISAAEIANAPAALRMLDRNGDGVLWLPEVVPEFQRVMPPVPIVDNVVEWAH